MIYIRFAAISWSVLLIAGVCVFVLWPSAAGTFYDIEVRDPVMLESIVSHLIAAGALYVFGRVLSRAVGPGGAWLPREVSVPQSSRPRVPYIPTARLTRWIAYLGLGVFVAVHIEAYGVEDLMRRDYYLPEPTLSLTIGGLLGILLPVVLAFFRFSTRVLDRNAAGMLLTVVGCILFAKNSRSLVFAYACFTLLPLFFEGRRKSLGLIVALHLSVSTFLLILVLWLRGASSGHGIEPYLAAFPDFVQELETTLTKLLVELLMNISFSVPVTQATLELAGNTEWSELAAFLNPLSGERAGWDVIADSRRVTVFIPYSALGELAAFGYSVLLVYLAFAATVFILHERLTRKFGVKGRLLLRAVGWFVCIAFMYLFLQYNLRSATRVIYYLLAFDIACGVFRRLMLRKRGGCQNA